MAARAATVVRAPISKTACGCVKRLRLPAGGCDCIELALPSRCACTYCRGEVRRIEEIVRQLADATFGNEAE